VPRGLLKAVPSARASCRTEDNAQCRCSPAVDPRYCDERDISRDLPAAAAVCDLPTSSHVRSSPRAGGQTSSAQNSPYTKTFASFQIELHTQRRAVERADHLTAQSGAVIRDHSR
jgi:hypothetical protein